MRIVFANQEIALVEKDGAGLPHLPIGVIHSARRKLTLLRAAENERSLCNWKSLCCEKMKDARVAWRSIRLTERYRMIFELNEDTEPQTATIMKIEDVK